MVATRRNDFSQHEVIGEGGVGGPGGSGSGPQDNPNDASGSGGNIEGVAPAEVLNVGWWTWCWARERCFSPITGSAWGGSVPATYGPKD